MSQSCQAADTVKFDALNERKKEEPETDLKGNAKGVQDTRCVYTQQT